MKNQVGPFCRQSQRKRPAQSVRGASDKDCVDTIHAIHQTSHSCPAGEPMSNPAAVVDRQIAAYNRHQLNDFIACYSATAVIQWEDGLQSTGRAEIAACYVEQFREGRCHAESVGRLVEGGWVVDHELVTGIGPERSQFIVVYRVLDGLITFTKFLGG
ncbi:nuclear transport factor 2 family protein [Streptomyces violarus]|uniref:nuclear transport factor 2 family protein n=1 Tax=Streptomyces violarus TaxID=67380 RepID=UPI00370404D5